MCYPGGECYSKCKHEVEQTEGSRHTWQITWCNKAKAREVPRVCDNVYKPGIPARHMPIPYWCPKCCRKRKDPAAAEAKRRELYKEAYAELVELAKSRGLYVPEM